MTLDESAKENDTVDEENGVKILSADNMAPYLEGAVIDFVESRGGGGFQIKTASTGDGCGGDGCSSCG